MEPSFTVNAFGCKVWALVVSQHHIGTFAADFSILCQFHFNIPDYIAHCAKPSAIAFIAVDTDDRRCFSKSIAFHHHKFGCGENP